MPQIYPNKRGVGTNYSMDDLLYLLHSDGADGLKISVGKSPMIVLEGETQPVEGPEITPDDAERLFTSITDTRQRRALREHGFVEFLYRFRRRASFVVRARLESGNLEMDIH